MSFKKIGKWIKTSIKPIYVLENKVYSVFRKLIKITRKLRLVQEKKLIDPLDMFLLLFIGALCYLIFFHHLGDYSLRMWDESRNGTNALEMLRNNNFLVTFFKGSPDMWNTKPPFFIWVAVLFYKLFGVTELSLRLPSAISASLVVFLIYLSSKLLMRDRWIGLLGSLIILSSMGFPDIHIGRSGDYDALLTLWVFLGTIATFIFLQTNKNKVLFFSALFWILAALTKGVAGIFMFPGIMIFVLITGKLKQLLLNKFFWVAFVFSTLIVFGYYLARNIVNPGYLAVVWQEDLAGRFGKAIGAANHEFLYYWNWWKDFRYQKWIYLFPFSFVSYFIIKKREYKQIVLYLYILAVSYFFIISYSETKQLWYDAQFYPLASLLIAVFIVSVIKKFPLLIRPFLILVLCFYLQRYIRTNIAYIYRPDLEKSNSCYKYGYVIREYPSKFNGYVGIDTNENYCMPFHFYLLKAGLNSKNKASIKPDDKILTCDSSIISFANQRYKTKITFEQDGCWGIKIGKKQ